MSHARKLSPGWYFVVVVVAASILAAAVVAMRYSVVHRPVASLHPLVTGSVAAPAPTLTAPEVSHPRDSRHTGRGATADGTTGDQIACGSVSHTTVGRLACSDMSESVAWTIYRERTRQFASLIGDREPIVLFRQLPGLGNAKRYVIAIVDDDRAPLDKFCKKLTAAGSTCNVMRNEIGLTKGSACRTPSPIGAFLWRSIGGFEAPEILGEASLPSLRGQRVEPPRGRSLVVPLSKKLGTGLQRTKDTQTDLVGDSRE